MLFEIIATADGLSKQIFFVLTNRRSLNIDDFPHLKDNLYKISCSSPRFTLIFVEILQCMQSAFMENGILKSSQCSLELVIFVLACVQA